MVATYTDPQSWESRNAVDASFADKGLMNSSAYAGARAKAANMDAERGWNQNYQKAMMALSLWEKLAAQNLAKKDRFPKSKWRAPKDAAFFKTLFQTQFGDPPENEEAPIGDPSEQWSRYSEKLGPSTFEMEQSRLAADAAADRSFRERALSASQPEVEKPKSVFEQMLDEALVNYKMASDKVWDEQKRAYVPDESTSALFPTQLINQFVGRYKVNPLDVARDARDPRQQEAIAVVKTMYPKTWQQRLGMGGDAPVATSQPANPAPAVAGFMRSHSTPAADDPYSGSYWPSRIASDTSGGFSSLVNFLNRGF